MTWLYSILADLIDFVHLGYVSYVALGQMAIVLGVILGWRWVRNPWFRWSHLVMILIVAVESMWSIECPLTAWSRLCRRAAGESFVGPPTFIGQLVENVMFFHCPDEVFTAIYLGFAGLVL